MRDKCPYLHWQCAETQRCQLKPWNCDGNYDLNTAMEQAELKPKEKQDD